MQVLINLECRRCQYQQLVNQDLTTIWYCHHCSAANVNEKKVRINEKKLKRNTTRNKS